MAESILAHISESRFYPSMGFVQEYSKYFKIFLTDQIQKKLTTKFSNKFNKNLFFAHFGPIFPIFGAKKIFLENPVLSRTALYGFLAPCQNLEKVNDTIQRKRPDRRKEGRTDERTEGQTLFL